MDCPPTTRRLLLHHIRTMCTLRGVLWQQRTEECGELTKKCIARGTWGLWGTSAFSRMRPRCSLTTAPPKKKVAGGDGDARAWKQRIGHQSPATVSHDTKASPSPLPQHLPQSGERRRGGIVDGTGEVLGPSCAQRAPRATVNTAIELQLFRPKTSHTRCARQRPLVAFTFDFRSPGGSQQCSAPWVSLGVAGMHPVHRQTPRAHHVDAVLGGLPLATP
jgi:hypothetical protein